MIHQIFPTNILIKDFDFSDEWSQNLTSFVTAIHLNQIATTGSYELAGKDSIPLFTEQYTKDCSELEQLRNIFIDGFYELAQSYSNNTLTREEIAGRVRKEFGKLPFMKPGSSCNIHAHAMADAFGIFYLSELDNKKDGGELILHDPAFSITTNYQEEATYSIATKKNRLVICPSRIWHEVSAYRGAEDRYTIVMNLNSVFSINAGPGF